MRKVLKNKKLIIIITIFILSLSCFTLFILSNKAAAESSTDYQQSVSSYFNSEDIDSIETLYNFDDSADYIYIKFINGGYSILAKETCEILEYSPYGEIPYSDQSILKYYGGPLQYYEKGVNGFVDIISGDTIGLSSELRNTYAQITRNIFAINNIVTAGEFTENTSNANTKSSDTAPATPPYDEAHLISPTSGAQYIPNADYFFADPTHGVNNGNSCTTVAVQLMLSYNNFFNDRRLINEQFLNGTRDNNPENNPNYCYSPITRNPLALGSNQDFHDYLYNIGIKGHLNSAKEALEGMLISHNIVSNCTINYKLDTLSYAPISLPTKYVTKELDAGRPIVLSTWSALNGTHNLDPSSRFNHSVLAYGYQTISPYADGKPYFGYIVHFGWYTAQNTIWTNASWYYSSLSMEIQHTHNYNIDTQKNFYGKYRELNCSECGHRMLDSLYSTDINGNQIIGAKHNLPSNIIIPHEIDGNQITAIASSAFENNANISNIVFEAPYNITSIGSHAFSGCTSLTNITLPENLTNIGYGAFAGCDNLTFTVNSNNPNYTAVNGVLYNKDKSELIQACKIPNVFDIPKTVSKISPFAFEYNTNLNTLLFDNSPEIGNNTFANCANLGNVYFDTYTAPVTGIDVFKGNVPLIIVPYNAQSDFKQSFSQYSDFITSQQFGVDFISNGQVIESWTVYNGSTIENLPDPTTVEYSFGGWYDNQDYTGTPYTNGSLWESDTTITLYAKLIPNDCMIIFDANGGTIVGNNFITVKYGSSFTTSITATKEGNVLDGWYDNSNEKYITADGRSTRTWDKVEPTTLKAKWSPKSYEIQINDDGSITWLSEDGFSNEQCYIQYGTVLSAINRIAIFKKSGQGFKEGKIFDHFEYNDSTLDWPKIPDLGENNSVITIIPVWINEVHTIYFQTLCDTTVNPIVKAYDSNITLPTPSRSGYTFNGWYTAKTGGTKVTWTTMPDLTPTDQNNGSTQLFANWTPITYKVYYQPNGGSGTMNFTTHTYDKSDNLRRCTFTKVGHDFMGWATSTSGKVVYTDGQSVQNLAATQSESITLYAVWEARRYSIIYKNLATNMVVLTDSFLYGEGITIMPKIFYQTLYGPMTEVEDFYGWYTSADFATQLTSISKTRVGNVTLYAKYDYFVTAVMDVGTHTVTDAGTSKNPKISLDIDLQSNHYEKVKNTTLNKIRIEVSFNLWEIDDGYQHIYLRNDNFISLNDYTLWSKKIDHQGGKKQYKYTIEVDLDKYKNTNSITFQFDASGAFSDTWKFNDFEAYVYLTN